MFCDQPGARYPFRWAPLLCRSRASAGLQRAYAFLALLIATAGSGCKHEAPPEPKGAPEAKPAMQAPASAAPAADEAQRERIRTGAELYARICAVCHGDKGQGYKADDAPAIGHQDFLTSVGDGFLRAAINEGRPGSTMSAFSKARGGPLAAADVEALVAFIRSWQTQPKAKLDESARRGDLARGRKLYARECARCHGDSGQEGPNIRLGLPALQRTASDGFLRRAIRHGRAGTPMEGFGDKLGDQAIEDLLAVVRSFAFGPPVHPPAAKIDAPLALGRVPLNPRGPEPRGFAVYPKTTPADVIHEQLERGARMALLDARPPADYVREHIKGAVSVPYYDPAPYFDKLPKNSWLVCYCACPSAESGELAQKLLDKGFKKVTVLAEGIGYWKAKKYEVATGDKP